MPFEINLEFPEDDDGSEEGDDEDEEEVRSCSLSFKQSYQVHKVGQQQI